ncbi:hypothetical protein GCM10011332_32030 [Terasakiella brassicae]|uniref:Uncharacterized protein n=1 Tax=Terasakiella brassicae TaxID=1634917 RepID=A0A917FG00_9PROT|nr:hypothetical protein [Terasakiella brassicae]GGF75625.1 hypothetical protein GCM10011332_32030 [Terasakiella brassicae]
MNVAFSHEVSLNLPIMENRESQINLALSEIYGGLSVIRFLTEEYEGKINTDDLTLFENNVLLAKKYADELAEIARGGRWLS